MSYNHHQKKNKKKTNQNNINKLDFFLKKKCMNNNFIVFSESDLLSDLLKKKIININQISFYKEPIFLEVDNIEIINDNNHLHKQIKKNHKLIEPIFIESPNILKTYYDFKNIPYKESNNKNTNLFFLNEKFKILNIRLHLLQEDELEKL